MAKPVAGSASPKQVVVAAAVSHGEAEPSGVDFVDRPRVVVVAPDQAEIQHHRSQVAPRVEVGQDLPQVLERHRRLAFGVLAGPPKDRGIGCRTN